MSGYKAPHRPWLPEKKYYKEYTKGTFPLPKTLFDNYNHRSTAAHTNEMNILKHMTLVYDNKLTSETMKKLDRNNLPAHLGRMTPEQRANWDLAYNPINEDFKKRYPTMKDSALLVWKFQRYMQDYLGTIASVDDNVGRLLDYLDQNGLTDNTVVVYTFYQGFYLGEHGWFDKRFMYNESFKTPLLIRWPHVIKPGITEDEMVQNLDFAQTFLQMAGVTAPKDMQGESPVPLLRGEKEKWNRDAVYYHYYEYPAEHAVKRHYGIATKKYKLIHFYNDVNEWELYDEENDPMEMNNVYNNPTYAQVVADMKRKLKELRKKYLDSDKLDQEFIDLYKEKRK